jgi:hypothetical protein
MMSLRNKKSLGLLRDQYGIRLGKSGFTLAETMVATATFGLVALTMTSAVKVSGILNVTADRKNEESMMVLDASNTLTVPQACTNMLTGISLPPTVGSNPPVPMVTPSPLVELSLTNGCAPQALENAPTPVGAYTQPGLCRGGIYPNLSSQKINVDNVILTNIQPMSAGSGLYSGDVQITGSKIANQIYGTTVINRTVQVYFNFNRLNSTIMSCQGMVTHDSSSNCTSLGCNWTGSSCDCCTPLGGVPTPMPNPTQCVLPGSNCELPTGFAWKNGFYACADSTPRSIAPGTEAILVNSLPRAVSGQVAVACCTAAGSPVAACATGGTIVIDSSSPPTCVYPSCTTPATWVVNGNTCTATTTTSIAAGTASASIVATNGTDAATFYCPMTNSGGTAQMAIGTCGGALPPPPPPPPPPTPSPSATPIFTACTFVSTIATCTITSLVTHSATCTAPTWNQFLTWLNGQLSLVGLPTNPEPAFTDFNNLDTTTNNSASNFANLNPATTATVAPGITTEFQITDTGLESLTNPAANNWGTYSQQTQGTIHGLNCP